MRKQKIMALSRSHGKPPEPPPLYFRITGSRYLHPINDPSVNVRFSDVGPLQREPFKNPRGRLTIFEIAAALNVYTGLMTAGNEDIRVVADMGQPIGPRPVSAPEGVAVIELLRARRASPWSMTRK